MTSTVSRFPSRRPWWKFLVRGGAAAALILLCTVLPFLPGAYDPLAAPISAMARVAGMAGLALIPLGALFLLAPGPMLATASRIAIAAVGLVIALSGFVSGGVVLGIGTIPIWTYLVRRVLPRWKLHTRGESLYLIILPAIVFGLQWMLLIPATELARERAMRNSAALIEAIEQYRNIRGHYPSSLLSSTNDYLPSVIGIDRYRYELAGDVYNLLFEQPSVHLDTPEFAVYNPLDQQTMTSHNIDLLEFAGRDLDLRRGYYAVHGASQPHWKYFWFD